MWVVCCGVLPLPLWGYLLVWGVRVLLSVLLEDDKQWPLFVGVVGLSCVSGSGVLPRYPTNWEPMVPLLDLPSYIRLQGTPNT